MNQQKVPWQEDSCVKKAGGKQGSCVAVLFKCSMKHTEKEKKMVVVVEW